MSKLNVFWTQHVLGRLILQLIYSIYSIWLKNSFKKEEDVLNYQESDES